MRVLVACEYSGRVRDAFENHGLVVLPIEGFDGYLVSACGRIFSRNHPRGPLKYYRELRPAADRKGYLGLTLCSGTARSKRRIHRIVAETFIPNPEGKPCVRHLNGDASDNSVSNLAWGTYAENEQDKHGHGTWESRRTGKLDAVHVALVRDLYRAGETQNAIAARLKVSRPTITRIVNGTTWGNIPCAS